MRHYLISENVDNSGRPLKFAKKNSTSSFYRTLEGLKGFKKVILTTEEGTAKFVVPLIRISFHVFAGVLVPQAIVLLHLMVHPLAEIYITL